MADKPNRLINEKSPYLLQHAYNPVDWYPWGDEAFSLAREEDKPIFLSVGYSTCHWCHVMERESFEDDRISAFMNRWFVSIKVDREERPDIDQLYMAAVQAMTGSGGWPMSVFLLPDGRPFYAGTYFPPESMYGRPGFLDVLHGLHEAWQGKRNELKSVASQIIHALAESSEGGKVAEIPRDIADRAFEDFASGYDDRFGGFGTAPKFPRPVQFNFLLRYWFRTGNVRARDMVLQTLKAMSRGGIRDHLGGGFHRYSTDPHWLVPHFEKMLYDQALLADSYLDAYQITGEMFYAEVAREIFAYILKRMTSPQGGFYSAEDADSEDPGCPGIKREGLFYLWTEEEVRKLLPGIEGDIFCRRFGVKKGGNVQDDTHNEFTGKNILHVDQSIREIAEHFSRSEGSIKKSLQTSIKILVKERRKRKKPHLDDKILVSWNGLMIHALARGAAILEDENLLAAARTASLFIKKYLYSQTQGRLWRRYRNNESGLNGQLDDYAFLVHGLLALYQADQNPEWLAWAINLTEKQVELFWDQEQHGFYDSVSDASLPFRMKGDYDGAEPAGNSIAAANLLFLGHIANKSDWTEKAKQVVELFSRSIISQPTMLPEMLQAWEISESGPKQVVIAGVRGREDTCRMLAAVHRVYAPGMFVLLKECGPDVQDQAIDVPVSSQADMIDQKATAYICENFTCQKPITDHLLLQNALSANLSKLHPNKIS